MARRTLALMVAGAPDRPNAARRWRQAIGFGLLTGVLAGFALLGLIAAPLFLWAQATEPEVGLQRPFVRGGLRSAPLFGFVAFVLTTVLSARWHLRSGGLDEQPEGGNRATGGEPE